MYSTTVNNAKLWQLGPAESHFLFKRLVAVPHGKRPFEQIFHQVAMNAGNPTQRENEKVLSTSFN
jgi:hypothetical protein